jgi:hypothetical protein
MMDDDEETDAVGTLLESMQNMILSMWFIWN